VPAPLSLGREIRRLRIAKGMTLAELSAGSGLREAYLAAIEDDRDEPSARALGRIVGHLKPADASYEQLARLLTAPEFDASGEYVGHRDLRPHAPRPSETGQAYTPGQMLTPDSLATATPGVWVRKTDVQLLDAAARLSEYTPEGQRAILAELSRRHLAGPENDVSDSSDHSLPEHPALQFDHAVTDAPQLPAGGVAVACSACQTAIDTEYFDVNGCVLCDRCRAVAESATETPTGIEPFIVASVLGLGAALAGAIIYYAVIAIANLQIGYIAILIGYMVGYAVRKGARGRGGRRFQLLAVALTYFAICLAYTPVVVKQITQANREATRTAATAGAAATPTAIPKPTAPRLLWSLLALLLFVFALPVLVVWGSLPSGLISAFIIFIGLRQSWKMTAAPQVQVFGPYRVGGTATAGSA
jgi:transcriptional regulator with XRE-family HTH domain